MLPARFVNPYSFAPLATAATANRGSRSWHDGRDPGLYSGTIEVTWTLRTPLLLPKNASQEGWLKGTAVRVPGSSIAGAVRSLHEALFNGCFRVVDDSYLPGYREAVHSNPDLRLAVVTRQRNGVPQELRLCDDPVWVDSGDLLARWPRGQQPPTTGDVVRFQATIEELEGLDRAEFIELSRVDVVRRGDSGVPPTAADAQSGARVLLVTSTSARKPRKLNGDPARALWVADRLTTELVTVEPEQYPEDADMLARFRAAVADTDDRRRLEQKEPDGDWRTRTTFEPVTWAGPDGRGRRTVGRRARATGLLFEGDPVWVLRDRTTGRITTMKLAHVWRRPGSGTVGDRLPDHLKPCVPDDPRGLCLSCATFGAADTTSGRKHEQVSYAGHVRFGAARGDANGAPITVDLAPLGAPRPGNGMFYLQRYQPAPGSLSDHEDPVATHWGGPLEGGRHLVAGRKFYWHADPDAQARALTASLSRTVPARYRATPKQTTAKLSRPATLVPAGTVLRSTVAVDQLDALGVHALLAALDPGRILAVVPGAESRDIATHLGGGKPFGLGSVGVTIEAVDLHPLSERYGGSRRPAGFATAPVPFRDLAARVGPFTGNLAALAVLLDRNALGDHARLVSYPPGSRWEDYQSDRPTSRRDETEADRFAQSFRFFGIANGERLKEVDRPWVPLPRPGEDPTIPIDPRSRRS